MNWDLPYLVSRSLRFQVSGSGRLTSVGVVSRPPQEVDLDALPVLLGFAAGATPREVFGRLQRDWEIDEAGFELLVHGLVAQEMLVPAGPDEARPPLPEWGFGAARTHFSMLRDPVRVMSYRAAIERHARGVHVLEIGCGTGILSLFAARAGARRVTAVEETRIAEVAAGMFAANGAAVDLRQAHSQEVVLDEPADLIVHEILGCDPFEENLLPVLEDARRRLLRPGGRLLPYRLEVCCFGVEVDEPPPEDDDRMLAEAGELSGLYGLDFGPFLQALADSAPPPGSTRTWLSGRSRFEHRILSEECRVLDIDFRSGALDLLGRSAALPLRIARQGTLGGVVLFFRAHLDEQTQLTTSPLAPPTSWGWDLRTFAARLPVVPGDQVPLAVELGEKNGLQCLSFELA